MTETKPYRPLPRKLYIDNSPIEGNGLFTSDDIHSEEELGITHIKNDSGNFHSDYIRTPLGGFVNHSENSNCKLYECGDYLKMKTTKDIKAGEELTLTYSLYEPCKNYI
jgi:SET domain-containing protein